MHGPICVVRGILQYVVHWYIILRHILMYIHVQSDLVNPDLVNPDDSQSEHIFLGTDLFSVICTS